MDEPDNILLNSAPERIGSPDAAVRVLFFGPFRLNLNQRILYEGQTPVRLGSRAMAILVALLEKSGGLATKEELVRVAWPETFVEEVNLRVHLAAIRRALRDTPNPPTYIANVSGRGYRFIATVSEQMQSDAPKVAPQPAFAAPVVRPQLPGALVPIFGREDAIETVASLVSAHRLVSVVGPGGIGKTALAITSARQVLAEFRDGAAVIDLSDVGEDRLAATIGQALHLSDVDDLRSLGSKSTRLNTLLLLDSCEQSIEAVAVLVETLLRSAPDIHILATSSEPLRAADERVYRLTPLPMPERDDISIETAMTYPAVQLLVDRITAGDDTLRYSDRDVRRLVALSRKLDGLPLAIEMAAARVQVFGISEVMARLETGIEFLVDGRRTAAPRHRSMRGLLDWSYEALSDVEQLMLTRLAIFTGAFTLGDAVALAGDATHREHGVIAAIGGLVAKSCLVTARTERAVTYRLPRHIRAYAYERLQEAADYQSVAAQHARLTLERTGEAVEIWQLLSRAAWLELHGGLVDDVRLALDWCVEGGDIGLGAELSVAAAPILLRAGCYGDMRRYASEVLQRADATAPHLLLRLKLILSTLHEDQPGPVVFDALAFEALLPLRRSIGAPWADAETLIAEAAVALRTGSLRAAVSRAGRAAEYAGLAGDRPLQLTAERLAAEAHHYAGEHLRAAQLAKALIAGPDWSAPPTVSIITTPHQSSMRVIEARRLWLMGQAAQSRHLLFEALNFAAERGPWPLCEALGLGACPLMLWYGEDDRAADFVVQLEGEAERAGLPHWRSWAALYRGVLLHLTMREGRRSEADIAFRPVDFLQAETWMTLTGSLRGPSLAAKASGWCAAEVLRVEGHEAQKAGDESLAAERFADALDLARRQGALAWELRAALSLARLWRRTRREAAHDLLSSSVSKFTEGGETSDLLAAKALLRTLGG